MSYVFDGPDWGSLAGDPPAVMPPNYTPTENRKAWVIWPLST
jgi:hypothetical protein